MRLGELLGMKWSDVDWNSRFIQVQRSWRAGVMSPTKTGETRRVDMSDQLTEALRVLLTERKKEALASGRGGVEEYVFHGRNVEGPMSQNIARYYWKRILSKAGVRDIKFHATRHSFASILLHAGVSPVYVKEQLGHSKIGTTVDIYGHQIPSGNRRVNILDEAPIRTPAAPSEKAKGAKR